MNADVLERRLDLAPLRGRRSGLTFCPFHSHRGRTPSFSVDLDRGLFFCHSCAAQGGVRRFAELIGEAPERSASAIRPPVSDYEAALAALLRVERHHADRRREWAPYMLANNYIRICRGAVEEAHRWARVFGPDEERTWNVLSLAARVETEANAIEAELDGILEGGRIG